VSQLTRAPPTDFLRTSPSTSMTPAWQKYMHWRLRGDSPVSKRIPKLCNARISKTSLGTVERSGKDFCNASAFLAIASACCRVLQKAASAYTLCDVKNILGSIDQNQTLMRWRVASDKMSSQSLRTVWGSFLLVGEAPGLDDENVVEYGEREEQTS